MTPSGPPAAPTITTVTPGDGSLAVAFTAGASGSTILNYEYQVNGTGPWVSSGGTTSPITIPGLTNGTSYSVQIRAVSAIGNGSGSNTVSATPRALPGAPTITGITTGAGSAAVGFTPGYGGGGTITDYEYQLNGTGGWISGATTTSPLTITGWPTAPRTPVAIRAHSVSGSGPASQSSSFTTPGRPQRADARLDHRRRRARCRSRSLRATRGARRSRPTSTRSTTARTGSALPR